MFVVMFVRRLCDFIEVMMEDEAINNASILCAQCSSSVKIYDSLIILK